MEGNSKRPDLYIVPDPSDPETLPVPEALTLQGLLDMLRELDADDEQTLDVLLSVVNEPEPADDDVEGWKLRRERAYAAKSHIEKLVGATGRSREIQEALERLIIGNLGVH